MPRVIILALSVLDKIQLNEIVERGINWRERQRAETLLLLDGGMSAAEVAERMGLNVSTIRSTCKQWLIDRYKSLLDLPRSGAPRKISPKEVDALVAKASAQPLTAPQLLAMHVSGGGVKVHLNTLMAMLRRSGLVWKRSRHSLKKTKPGGIRCGPARDCPVALEGCRRRNRVGLR